MKYLDKQLTETENMSPESVAVRQNIKKCFESISCFLMPTIGDGKDSEDFDGRVSQLREDFVYKMRDFITILLNSEEMSPKMIDKTPVTGEEMFHYFRSCVDVFNNSEGPDVQRIIDMTAKIEANIYLRKLKVILVNHGDNGLFTTHREYIISLDPLPPDPESFSL